MTSSDFPHDPVWDLPVRGPAYSRPDAALIERLGSVGAATASAKLHGLGISRSWINGPTALERGNRVVGSALTLQMMPQREDVASGLSQEYIERETALWAVLEAVQQGDVLVIQANGSEYFKRKGGAGIVVDGRIRDAGRVRALGVPIWCTGTTPNYASQVDLFPWAYDVPVAVGGALCLPGDLIVADADGAVIVPVRKAEELIVHATEHEKWEAFSRSRIDEGGRLSDYYPLTDATRTEYELWQAARDARVTSSTA